jgi:hypothetical protein
LHRGHPPRRRHSLPEEVGQVSGGAVQ